MRLFVSDVRSILRPLTQGSEPYGFGQGVTLGKSWIKPAPAVAPQGPLALRCVSSGYNRICWPDVCQEMDGLPARCADPSSEPVRAAGPARSGEVAPTGTTTYSQTMARAEQKIGNVGLPLTGDNCAYVAASDANMAAQVVICSSATRKCMHLCRIQSGCGCRHDSESDFRLVTADRPL